MTQKHILNKIWENYPEALKNEHQAVAAPTVEKLIAEMFALGKFYYYVLNTTDSTLSNFHENILEMHRLKAYPQHLKEILDLIHPEDIAFVIEAERMTLEKMKEIGFEHQLNLKCSYCFRMKTGNGSYELFHHQSLHTKKDKHGKLLQAVNIHTNIHHITPVNNYVVLVAGIGGRSDFHQIPLKQLPAPNSRCPENLTKREVEILHLIAKGFSSAEISNLLFVSVYTVATHRKNILQKTDTKNSSELIKKCIEWGFI